MTGVNLLEKALAKYLAWRTRPERAQRFFAKEKSKAAGNDGAVRLSRVRVAATQTPLSLVTDPLDWVALLYRQASQAVEAGAQLVVFPEDITLPLLGLIPGVKKLAGGTGAGPGKPGTPDLDMALVFRAFGAGVETFYRYTMSTLAARLQVHILGGSRLVPDQRGRVLNVASLFGPRGQLIGSQAKAHLLPLETNWGLCRGTDLKVFKTPLGNIAFPVCMDATYFETFRILAQLGADLVIIPIANPEGYNRWKALRGIWPRVQESYVYGIKSALVGRNFFGMHFTGKAGIFAPLELHPPDGVLALGTDPEREDLVIADLNIERLRAARETRLYGGDVNLSLYHRYFPAVYDLANNGIFS